MTSTALRVICAAVCILALAGCGGKNKGGEWASVHIGSLTGKGKQAVLKGTLIQTCDSLRGALRTAASDAFVWPMCIRGQDGWYRWGGVQIDLFVSPPTCIDQETGRPCCEANTLAHCSAHERGLILYAKATSRG